MIYDSRAPPQTFLKLEFELDALRHIFFVNVYYKLRPNSCTSCSPLPTVLSCRFADHESGKGTDA